MASFFEECVGWKNWDGGSNAAALELESLVVAAALGIVWNGKMEVVEMVLRPYNSKV